MLHWANKDQYYTKSGESFSNYAFTLENGKKVQFRLVEADTAKDNRKDNEQARVFALIEPQIKTETDENGDEIQTDILPFNIQGDLLTLRFEYKSVNKKEKQSDYITQAVERIQNFAIPDEFQGIFKAMPTEKNKNRTLLEKYLTDYTAKNTADYFIHKNLGKFLNQELDFYIKNEVMNLDNIQDSTDFSHIEQNLQTIKILKTVAKEIIAFLAQLEDFQKKLWLKKKFVAGCHYLITLDHLTEAQVQAALDNPKQTAQWQALFNVNTSSLNVVELCKNYPHLVVDTALFEPKFQADVLNKLHDLDEKTNGLLIHSDNFQALNLLQERYKEQVKCIYIDPPYNLDKKKEKDFLYKDKFKHSSWISFMWDRILKGNDLANDAILFASIDEHENLYFQSILNDVFGDLNFIADLIWQNKTGGGNDSTHIAVEHEYIKCFSTNKELAEPFFEPYKEDYLKRYKEKDELGRFYWDTFKRKSGKQYYAITCPDGKILEYDELGNPISWLRSKERFLSDLEIGDIKFEQKNDKSWSIFFKQRLPDGKKPRSILNNSGKTSDGSDEQLNLFKKIIFSNAKPSSLIKDLISYPSNNDLILDYFGGSGTTAHAVINLNREDNGNRKYILVEQGEYFDSVLKPRVQKVIFAKEWKDGKPQADNGVFGGASQIVKVLKLESYEDTLNNLELKQPVSDLFAQNEALQNDYLLHYMLDVESRDSLLNTQHFAKPFDYQLNIATTSAGAYEAKTIDLVETFNYLIGLRVSEINDKRETGLVTVQGTNASGEKTLVIWRDCEKYDYDKLNRYLDSRDINPQDSEFEVVYINGDHNVPTVFTDSDDSVKTLKVRSIEAEFLQRMFE